MDPREQLLTQIEQAAAFIGEQADLKPLVGIILGSGMSATMGNLKDQIKLNYTEIPNFPEATTQDHEGNLVIGSKGDVVVAVMQGRFHFYEGYTLWGVTFPIRVLAKLGCKFVIITNCAGGLREDTKPGDFLVIEDHINLMPANPLTGPPVKELGPRFVDLDDAYDPGLRFLATDAGSVLGLSIKEGVYVAVQGPSYETAAEIEFLRKIGGDAVGMSTVPEVIVAKQQSLKVLGLSLITNNLFKQKHVSHKQVLAVSANNRAQLEQLLAKIIEEIGEKKDEL